MTTSAFEYIQNQIARAEQTLKPFNCSFKGRTHSNEYIYAPVIGFEFCFKGIKDKRHDPTNGAVITTLANSSFLADEGYNINLDDDVRQGILRQVVKAEGKRRVTDHLRFLINTRQGQYNGTQRFARAISIWQEDINYVARL